MTQSIQKSRVSLSALKVVDSTSQETLCYTAIVHFDGHPIARAQNDGRGGITILRALDRARKQFAQAEKFAKSLPPVETVNPRKPGQTLTRDFTLDELVDELAYEMNIEGTLRRYFDRDYTQRVAFIKHGKVHTVKGVKLKDFKDRKRLFYQLRKVHGKDIVVLAELPREQAFSLWKKCIIEEMQS